MTAPLYFTKQIRQLFQQVGGGTEQTVDNNTNYGNH